MKKSRNKGFIKLTSIFLALLLSFMAVPILSSCEPVEPIVPGAEPSSLIPSANNTFAIGKSTKVWSALYVANAVYVAGYTQTFPSSTQTLVGRTTTDTLTNKTLTTPTITSPTVTGTVSGNATYTGPVLTFPVMTTISRSGTLTLPTGTDTLVGRATTDTLTNKSLTSPVITGTSVVSNRASGISDNISTESATTGVVVTHGMSGTPTRIWLSYAGSPGTNDYSLYPSSINGTAFTIKTSANITNVPQIYWLAYILDE